MALCLAATPAPCAERQPLLMEGKKTLFQRALTRPGALLAPAAGQAGGKELPALSILYVYDRKAGDGAEWLEVGADSRGGVRGWVRADATLPWKQQLTLAFTNPAGRDRALLFREKAGVLSVLEAPEPGAAARPLLAAAQTPPLPADSPAISIEPETHVDLNKRFYLLPILQAEEAYHGAGFPVRVLEVASVTARPDPKDAKPAADHALALRNFSANLVFVIDSTVSMDPYIDRTREAVRRIHARVQQAGLSSRVRFGLVAFRSSVKAVPGLEYVTRLYADPNTVADGDAFMAQVKGLSQAKVSSARYAEDSYAGVMTALRDIDWSEAGGRYVVLITDAGALRGNDPLSETRLDAEQVRLEAEQRGAAIYTLHLKTPAGRNDHAAAQAQYQALSLNKTLGKPLYYPVDAGSVDEFGRIVDSLAEAIVAQVKTAAEGRLTPADAARDEKDAARRAAREAQMVGRAMQLAYLGRVEGTEPPRLLRAWIADRDFAKPDLATTDVRVLLTKNQLSDLQQAVKGIVDAGQAAQLTPDDFFKRLRSAAAVLGRDPNQINRPDAAKLGDLGLLGEYLDDLPYKSKVMSIDQATWGRWSIGEQQAFLDELERKLRLYQLYHDDTARWIALDTSAAQADAVFPVPLEALP
ncbi:serine/threonine protein kinase [Azospirillum sp. TSO22-1]|nr:serine/threonine protein kinase [Azospirillum sp. TSO22-1]